MEVSIIIINYNSSSYTVNCIDSIFEFTTGTSFEIIVVDNASMTSEIDLLEKHQNTKNFRLIKSKVNLGFGGGNQMGYQFASGKYVLFLNNDTLLVEDSISQLVRFAKAKKDVGLIGIPQVDDKGNHFKYSYRQFIDLKYHLFNQKAPSVYYSKKTDSDLSEPFEVNLVSGAFMFFKTDAYHRSGGFDTNIFLFYEEMDICLRLKKLGVKTVFYPKTKFIHFGGQSSMSLNLRKEFTISYLYVIQKNYNFAYFTVLRVILFFKYGIKSLFKPSKYFQSFKIVLKGGNSLAYSLKQK